ncbi:hypothetical protein DUNSADRAFT_16150 [Dunaliella salina]|uniref:Encoded protein n=1 Tax=Dunaliella salina TaxID=3046 RepID=A0ABQ7G462_DUNSA|nr:hypothetical protein DUNSADRAFT_16150 [Dunaliella salina]|eukprot:KAF5829396.1 hypothetical protein DUNSADRAFT_16150 [Dunaliella salina]
MMTNARGARSQSALRGGLDLYVLPRGRIGIIIIPTIHTQGCVPAAPAAAVLLLADLQQTVSHFRTHHNLHSQTKMDPQVLLTHDIRIPLSTA